MSPHFIGVKAASFSNIFWVCSASSRVGSRISARVPDFGACVASNLSSTGNTKAAVLPLPVLAETIRSLPVNATGMACAWTSVASVKPSFSRALKSFGLSGKSVSKDTDACLGQMDGLATETIPSREYLNQLLSR